MVGRLLLLASHDLSDDAFELCRRFCQDLADAALSPVALGLAPERQLADARAKRMVAVGAGEWHEFRPQPALSAAPMSSASFVWREDGRPDWASMWTSFCDLALYGGPPHRGDADALRVAPDVPLPPGALPPALAEIRRGIWETTGLFSEPAAPGWLAVTCDSPKMAAWLCACIILENVDARCEDERLLVPASSSFALKDEVKSVVTVVAKTVHYWQQHVATVSSGAPVSAR